MTDTIDKPAKVKKPKVETYQVDGYEVTLTQAPVDQDQGWSDGSPRPATRSKWEIRVNGGLVGFAFYPLGVGNPWVFTSLVPKCVGDLHSWGDPFYVRAWEPPVGDNSDGVGRYATYGGLMGVLTKITPWRQDAEPDKDHGQWARTYQTDFKGFTSREEIARFVPKAFRANRLPGPDGVLQRVEKDKADRIAKAIREREEKAESERKAEEYRVRREAERAAAETLRRETLEGLQDIQAKFGFDMTNFESAALAEAIKTFGG